MSQFRVLSQQSLLGMPPSTTISMARKTAVCSCVVQKQIVAVQNKNIFTRPRELHTSLQRNQSVENKKVESADYPKDAFLPAPKLEPTHGIKVAELRLESFYNDRKDLNFHVDFVRRVAAAFGIPCSLQGNTTRHVELITVPAAPFVHKRSQENYWKRTISVNIILYDANQTVVDKFIDYLDANPPIDIRVHITRHSYKPLGWGKQLAEKLAPAFLDSVSKEDSAFDLSLDDPDVLEKVTYIRKHFKVDLAAEDNVDLDKLPIEKEVEETTAEKR